MQRSKQVTLYAMNTSVLLTCYGDSSDECISECSSRLNQIEKELDIHRADGSIWKLNHSGGEWTELSSDAYNALKSALIFAADTNGAFDPTIGSILSAWDDFSANVVPNDTQAKEAASHCDYTLVELDEQTQSARIGSEQQVALGGIGKGYAADELNEIYKQYDCTGIINLGGNIYAVGPKSDGDYTIAIRNPFDETSLSTTVKIPSGAVVTSGAYERYFTLNGVLYHHIFDPKTGLCADSDLASVSIISENSSLADAYSTAVFVMGFGVGRAFLEERSVHAILIQNDGTITEVLP